MIFEIKISTDRANTRSDSTEMIIEFEDRITYIAQTESQKEKTLK